MSKAYLGFARVAEEFRHVEIVHWALSERPTTVDMSKPEFHPVDSSWSSRFRSTVGVLICLEVFRPVDPLLLNPSRPLEFFLIRFDPSNLFDTTDERGHEHFYIFATVLLLTKLAIPMDVRCEPDTQPGVLQHLHLTHSIYFDPSKPQTLDIFWCI